MNPKKIIKQTISHIAANRFCLSQISHNKITVLTLHRVLPDEQRQLPIVQSGIVVFAPEFKTLIEWLLPRFTIISMAECVSRIHNQKLQASKPLLCITFDDGWRDNVEVALPILEEYQVPASLFVATGFIGQQQLFWWDILAKQYLANTVNSEAILQQVKQHLTLTKQEELLFNQLQNNNDKQAKVDILNQLIATLKYKPQQQLYELAQTLQQGTEYKSPFLNWQQLNTWIAAGNEVGAHTVDHTILTELNPENCQWQIEQSKLMLDKLLGSHNLPVFCYPNGNNNEQVQQAVSANQYAVALGTQQGLINHKTNPLALPRFNIASSVAKDPKKLAMRMLKSQLKAIVS